MQLAGKIAVVTGGANGIGLALGQRFIREGARVMLADLDGDRAQTVARECGALGMRCDVRREADIQALIRRTTDELGPIDVFCSNAGIVVRDPDQDNVGATPDAGWEQSWQVNVLAHVYAARNVLPAMIARGGGYLLNTVSAAGVLNSIGSASYATTKHAALGFAENIAIAHRDAGICVSIICPQGVRTALIGANADKSAIAVDGIISPEEVADATVKGMAEERFLILPHPAVATYMQRKVNDYDRWIAGMAKLRRAQNLGTL